MKNGTIDSNKVFIEKDFRKLALTSLKILCFDLTLDQISAFMSTGVFHFNNERDAQAFLELIEID